MAHFSLECNIDNFYITVSGVKEGTDKLPNIV